VGDNTDFLGTATAYLSSCGYQVLAARDIPGATELLRRIGFDVDVVLIDLTLGEDSGFDLIQVLKSIHSDLPLIAFSGTSSSAALQSAVTVGASEILRKPVGVEWQAAIERVRRRCQVDRPT
jgi:CheY-like chemotaxis protein